MPTRTWDVQARMRHAEAGASVLLRRSMSSMQQRRAALRIPMAPMRTWLNSTGFLSFHHFAALDGMASIILTGWRSS